MKKTIKLRSHHLELLYDHYLGGHSLDDIKEILEGFLEEKHARNTIKALSKIVNEQYNVIFVKSLDNGICPTCPKYAVCSDSLVKLDKKYAERYGVKFNNLYTAREILRILEAYKNKR